MKKAKLFSLFAFFLLTMACGDDDGSQPQSTDPTISVTSTTDLSVPVCVGQIVRFSIQLRSNSQIGIQRFVIRRNGTEDIVEETTFNLPNINFTFDYQASDSDLATGQVTLEFILTDNNQKVASESIEAIVVAEFVFTVEGIEPDPSLDLVNNTSISDVDGANVDILLVTETQPCGSQCVNTRHTFISKNDSRFYDILFGGPVNIITNEMKQADVLAAIQGLAPQDSLVVYSNYDEDVTPNGFLNRFPLVIKIRGTDEYAIMDRGQDLGTFTYKKRSESAGG